MPAPADNQDIALLTEFRYNLADHVPVDVAVNPSLGVKGVGNLVAFIVGGCNLFGAIAFRVSFKNIKVDNA